MKKSILKNGLVLAAFALATTALLAITHRLTLPVIQHQQQSQLLNTLNQIIAANSYDNQLQHDCTIVSAPQFLGNDKPKHIYRALLQQQPTALAIETTAPDGYSGNIEILVGINAQQQVTGVRVLEHKETPGLGDKVDLRIDDWILSFNGKSLLNPQNWAVKKDGGSFDQFTGATITPRAVVRAVNQALQYSKNHWQQLFDAPNQCQEPQL